MVEISVTGESMGEVNTVTTELSTAQRLVQKGHPKIIEEMIEVEDAVKQLVGDGGSTRRNKIAELVDIEGSLYQHLQLLQSYGIVSSSGQGGNWKYTRD